MHKRHFSGFTLVELITTLSILVIIITMGLPSLSRLVETNRASALADLIQAHLAHARASSVMSNRDVELCGSSDGEVCDDGWGSGWILRTKGEATPISRHQLDDQSRLRWRGFSKTILFRSNGTAPLGNGRFIICDAAAKVVWQLIMNRQGRVRRVSGLEQGQDDGDLCT